MGKTGEVEDGWLPRMPFVDTEVPNSPHHTCFLGPSPLRAGAAPSLRDLPLLLSQPPSLPPPEPQHQAPPLGDALIEGPEDYHHL